MRLPLREGTVRGTVYDADGRHILTIHDPTVDPSVVVRAVNSYRALREAVQAIIANEMPDYKAVEEFGGYVLDDDLRKKAICALRKARGEE